VLKNTKDCCQSVKDYRYYSQRKVNRKYVFVNNCKVLLDPDPYSQCGSGSRKAKSVDNHTDPHKEKNNVTDPDPNPPDPYVLGLPDPDPLVKGMDPDPSLFL
jgi:hypothetical protein